MAVLSETRKAELSAFARRHRLAVLASAGPDGAPQAALVNIAVRPDLSLVFETTSETRKFANIARDPRVALVIGWEGQETLQIEGLASRPDGRRLEEAQEAFLAVFPDKSPDADWPGNSYFTVRPYWLRFSNYYRPRHIEEYRLAEAPAVQVSNWRRWLIRLADKKPPAV